MKPSLSVRAAVVLGFAAVFGSSASAFDYQVKALLQDSTGTTLEFVTWRIISAQADSVSKARMAQIPAGIQLPDEVLAQMAPKPAAGGVTDADGVVLATVNTPGKYRLNITSSEILPVDVEFELSDGNPVADLGVVKAGISKTLNEVVVTAMRPLVVKEIDRIGYDVAADTESKTSMLDQILRKVPLVSVDPDGTIRVKGSTNFKIYKNGRPNKGYSNNAKEIFKAIPASTIKRIEVITDPGSREDADSGLAILNIVTDSQSAMKGVLGTASLRAGTRSQIPMPNLYLTTQINNLTVSVFGGMFNNLRKYSRSTGETEEKILSTGVRRRTEQWSEYSALGGYGGLELSLELDTLNLFTAEFNAFAYKNKSWSEGATSQFDRSGNLIYFYRSGTNGPSRSSDLDLDGSFNYQRSTRLKGETITLSYMISNNSNNSKSDTYYTDLVNAPMEYTGQCNDIDQKSLEHTFQIDWSRPLNDKIKFDLGGKYIFRDNNSNNTLTYEGQESMDVKDRFNHNTNIGALYTDWRGKYGKFGARAGVRYEFSRMSRKYHDPDKEDYHSDFNDWVPNVAVNYEFNDAASLKLSYGRRISRPGIGSLDPTVIKTPTSVSSGNPDLKSCYYNNYNLEFGLTKMKYNFSVNVGYTTSDDGFLSVRTVDADNILHTTTQNAGKSRRLNVNVFGQLMLPKTMMFLNGGWSLNREEDPTRGLSQTRPMYNASFYVRQTLPWKLNLSGAIGYYSGFMNSVYGYSKMYNSGFFNFLMLQRSFLKEDRLQVGLQMNNPFGAYRHIRSGNFVTQGDMRSTSFNYRKNRCELTLSVSYRFGSLRAYVRKTERSITNDDVERSSSTQSQDTPTQQ